MQELAGRLDGVRDRARRLLVLRGTSLVVAISVLLLFTLITLDWIFRFPEWARWFLLIVELAVCVLACIRVLLPTFAFHPSRTDIALRIEEQHPAGKGHVASAIEFIESSLHEENELARRSVDEAMVRVNTVRSKDVFSPAGTRCWLALAILLVISISTSLLFMPGFGQVGMGRLFLPMADLHWPARTAVISLMDTPEGGPVRGRGTAVVLRARNTTPGDPGGQVKAVFRVLDGDDVGAWNTILLTHQSEGVHERIIESNGTLVEFQFKTDDAETPIQQLRLVDLPRVVSAQLDVEPPLYARGVISATRIELTGRGSLQPHVDPILRGSRVRLVLDTNRPIPVPTSPDEQAEWTRDVLGWSGSDNPPLVEVVPDSNRINLTWPAVETSHVIVQLQDEHGLQSIEPWSLSFPVVGDHEPVVAFEEPPHDLSVLPTAVIEIWTTGSDDISLEQMGVELHANEQSGEEESPSINWKHEEPAVERTHEARTSLDLAGMVEPGAMLELYATASDIYRDEEGVGRLVHSAPRRIQVVDRSQFLSMLRQQLGLLEQRAKDLEEREDAVQRIVRTGGWSDGDMREQASIGRTINEQQELLESITRELERNRASDQQVESLVRFTSSALENAARASGNALQSMGDPANADAAVAHQDEVRFELQEIVSILGEDEEAWLVSRKLDQLIEKQRDLRGKTSRMGSDLLGLTRDEMTSEQQDRVDALSQEQLGLTEAARDLLESLDERSDSLREINESRAESMESASEIAREQDLVEHVREASEQISESQMQQATRSQDQALASLSSMRRAIQEDQKIRVQELARRLEAVKQAVERLVQFQRRELLRLDEAVKRGELGGRDTPMVRLRTNTLSVAKQARDADEATRSISRDLEQAAGSQAGAISSLRSDPVDALSAVGHEERSLQLLEGALEQVTSMAEEAQQQADQQERDDLASMYQALAERESIILQDSSDMMTGEPLDRRGRFEAKRLGRIQEELRLELIKIVDSNPDLGDSPVLIHVHDLIDSLSLEVTGDLQEGQVDQVTIHRERAILRNLTGLADGLRGDGEEDRFAEAGGGNGMPSGSAGGGEQGLVPPIAEVRILKSMQEGLLDETRELEVDKVANEDRRALFLSHLARQQRSLAELGADMLKRLQPLGEEQDINLDKITPGPTPPSWNQEPPGEEGAGRDASDLPDLDELLGIEGEDVEEMPEQPDDGPRPDQAAIPLYLAIDAMEAAAHRLESDAPGIETQRLQQEVIFQLDQLIQMAQRQQSPTSSSSSGGGSDANAGQEPQPEPGEASASPGSEQSGAAGAEMEGRDPLLGAAIEETRSEWGALPERVRQMLRQGRQDAYSSIYERMTIEYYRRLAREAKDD